MKKNITFPCTEGFLIDGRTCYCLNNIKQHILWCIPELLNNPINGFPVLKVNVIVGVFCFATSMSLKLIGINNLNKQENLLVGSNIRPYKSKVKIIRKPTLEKLHDWHPQRYPEPLMIPRSSF